MVGETLAHYRILEKIGSGGMGEVYRARDSKLDRDVAIKVLPEGFATDQERLSRFEREAKTLAALNHPNIAHIHGVEDAGRTSAIVMELVEGDDLSQRLARGSIGIAEALAIARQVADAVQTAHDHGVIHRDLKPANVKVTASGTVKLLDFGLAKVTGERSASAALSQSPTVMDSMPGTLIGTAAYMSPEQVKGLTADTRSDVWAFGCLLFEMLTGRPAFAAATTSEMIANVLTKEPDWQQLPPDTPEAVRRLLRRCLQKSDALRLRAIADARLEIDEAQQPDVHAPQSRTTSHFRKERLAWAAVVALLGSVVAVLAVLASRRPAAPSEVRFDVSTPDAHPFLLSSVAVSPDGRQILFVADSDGQPHVWLRSVDSLAARPLPGTGNGLFPFWSPDARSIAFYADGFLKRLDLDGGLVRSLTKATVGMGGTWNGDGVILFVRNPANPIMRVSADGGPAIEATRVDSGQVGHTFPHFLPDGKRFLYYVTGTPDVRGIHVGELDGSSSLRLVDADAGGVYMNGHLLFIRQTAVLAQAFDVNRLEVKGSPFQVADGAFGRGQPGIFNMMLSASAGTFAFREGAARFVRQFMWVDRSGHPLATVGDPLSNPDGVSYSPDRSHLVFFERGAGSSDLWLLDTRRGLVSRFTDEPDEDIFPVWARDSDRIIYSVVRNGRISLSAKNIANSRKETLIEPQGDELFASDTSLDGRYLIYQRNNSKTGWDIWALAGDAKDAPIPIVQTDADERTARLSPDGRWVAFASNSSSTSEIYLQPFPGPGRVSRISIKGGDSPQWRLDGKELFYLALDGRLMAAPVKPAADAQSLEVGPPVPLFAANVGGVGIAGPPASNYAASADGQRFLVNRLVREAGGTSVRVVLNWGGGQ